MHAVRQSARVGLTLPLMLDVMHHFRFITLIFIFTIMTTAGSNAETGVIGRLYEDGLPLIYSFVKEQPSQDNVARFQWLTIISLKYDGSNNNGMPLKATNTQMLALQDSLSGAV